MVKVDRWFASSKTCSCCGWVDENLTLANRVFHCKACGLILDRDLNASRNILQEALRIKEKAVGVNTAQRTSSECQTEIA